MPSPRRSKKLTLKRKNKLQEIQSIPETIYGIHVHEITNYQGAKNDYKDMRYSIKLQWNGTKHY